MPVEHSARAGLASSARPAQDGQSDRVESGRMVMGETPHVRRCQLGQVLRDLSLR